MTPRKESRRGTACCLVQSFLPKLKTYALLVLLGLTAILLPAVANGSRDVVSTINSVVKFSELLPPGTTEVSARQHKKATKLLEQAVEAAAKAKANNLSSTFDKRFAKEWNLFHSALKDRLVGWKTPDVKRSKAGIEGMERFRVYYTKNQEWISAKISGEKKRDESWITWNPLKGELLPRIGCNKGPFLSWIAGCGYALHNQLNSKVSVTSPEYSRFVIAGNDFHYSSLSCFNNLKQFFVVSI